MKNFCLNFILSLLITKIVLTDPINDTDLSKILFKTQIPIWISQCKSSKTVINNISKELVNITIGQFTQSMLPTNSFPATNVYGYGCQAFNPITGQDLGFVYSAPGPTIKVTAGVYMAINFTNNITSDHMFGIDWQLMMDPYDEIKTQNIRGVPAIVHVHGQIINSKSDGYPGSFTTAYGNKGPHYNSILPTINSSFVLEYPNLLDQSTIFYHDHTIGLTRLNVYAGMSGFFIIQSQQPTILNSIDKKHDIMLLINDKTFGYDGSLKYPVSWVPEFFADTILVNGYTWPYMKIQSGLYRIRLLNGCNARFINVTFQYANQTVIPFTVVKADGNYLSSSYQTTTLVIFVAERYEILINLTETIGNSIYLMNNAVPNFQNYNPLNSATTANIMRFDITYSYTGSFSIKLPIKSPIIYLQNPIEQIHTVLIENLDNNDKSLGTYIDGHSTNIPFRNFLLNTVYQMFIINLTTDPHSFHIHLTNFQIMLRYNFDADRYKTDFLALNGAVPFSNNQQKYPQINKYLTSGPMQPFPYQNGYRDMLQIYGSQITVVRFRFSLFNGDKYPIDVLSGPGYLFHCHILEHQDNSMMVMFKLIDNKSSKQLLSPYTKFVLDIFIPIAFILLVLFLIYLYRRYFNNFQLKEVKKKNMQSQKVSIEQNLQISQSPNIIDKDQNSRLPNKKNQKLIITQ